jgi:hypothetical protein
LILLLKPPNRIFLSFVVRVHFFHLGCIVTP